MRKILVGVDRSKESELAVGHAVDRARRDGAEVVLVMVDAIPSDPPIGLAPRTEVEYRNLLAEHLRRHRTELDAVRERWSGQGATISQLVVSGLPDEVLPGLAAETGADLVAVGSHGRTGIMRVLLGSVAERVARLAPCSVLVARGEAPHGGYRHVVLGTDFSERARLALHRAIDAAAPGARLDLVHSWQVVYAPGPPEAGGLLMPGGEVFKRTLEGIHAQGAELVAAVRARADLDVQFHAVEAPPMHGTADFARAANADLIVVGSHGRRGLRRFLLGSVAEVTARHASCSTLIARE
jgi:nucleotide-binding universal stress UspA family protein